MRDKRPYVKPVTKIELNTGNEKLRWIAVVVLLLVGVAAIAFGVSQALSVNLGWEEVQARLQEPSVASDFKFQYDFSEAGGSAAQVNRALIQCYGKAAVKAYKLFSADVEEPGLFNMAYLNAHVNEVVAVDEDLHKALSQIAASGNRQLFLTPARVEYDRVFLCENDGEAAIYDPARNGEIKSWLTQLAVFVNDPAHICLEILENNQVKLAVSQEYLAFGSEYGIEIFADFGWMRNAFAADLMAEELIAQGYTKGYLASFDGFTWNLDASGGDYIQNIFARQGTDIYMPGRMHYTAPASMVTLRDYPLTDRDRWGYYCFEDGTIVTAFLDSRDCMSKSAVSDLTAYSRNQGCGQILLAVCDAFIADTFQGDILMEAKQNGIFSVWAEGKTMCYNDLDLDLELLSDSAPGYSKKRK